jgi:hypothetical protein
MSSRLPIVLPSGHIISHLSARRRNEIVDTVFEMVGGVERLAHEVERSPEAYWQFMKLWGKGLPRVSSNEHTMGGGVEDLLERLDEEDRKSKEQQVDLVETSPGHFEAVVPEADT